MDKAENLVREYAKKNPLLAVWRRKWAPYDWEPEQKFDMILAGMLDENSPDEPSGLVLLKVWKHSELSTSMSFISNTQHVSASVPFDGGHDPLERLEEYAKKLEHI